MTESRVLAEVLRDEALYRQSGGGVTFSGGEPLLQPDFLLRLLETCRERGIHTAVDTCGASPAGVLDRVADLADLFLYDLKHLDDGEHRRMTGASNREILDNLRMLARRQAPVRVRFPVIPGVNDAAAHVRRLGEFVSSLGFREIDVVPYRKPVPGVYEALGRPNSSMALQEPQATVIAEVMQRLSGCGLTADVAPRRV